jgi:hypothetical protein
MTSYIKKLPPVFQTVTEKQFFAATVDQVFSKKDSSLLAGFIGRRIAGEYNPINDFYLPEPTKDRTWWQLESTAYARNTDTTKSNIFFYDDLLNRIKYYGGNTLNQDRLFDSEYYSFGPPIDYDMFINYQNYYWIEQGLPPITITGVQASDIIGQQSYTTPEDAIPSNFTLSTGMTIILVDDVDFVSPHVVENFGGCIGISLVQQFSGFTSGTVLEFLPWDTNLQLSTGRIIQNKIWDLNTWETEAQPGNGDYITIERGSVDRNAWSRTNKWFHIDTINKVVSQLETPFPINSFRALRPIIQFLADLNLYKSGTQFRSDISYGLNNDQFGNPILLSAIQGQQLTVINTTYDLSITENTLVCFFNDTSVEGSLTVNQYIYKPSIQLDNSVIFLPYSSSTTPIINGDIIFILSNAPFDGAIRGQTWYYDGIWQEVYNDKVATNQPPLFQLYDHAGVPLDDINTYPNSTFTGNKIFSYKINSTPGATIDPVLGFPIVYTALGQASDIIFQNNIIVDRYTYSQSLLPIAGYYYYKTTYDAILYNNWNLYDDCNCCDIVDPCVCNFNEISKQRVIDKYVVGYGSEYKFKISVTPYNYPDLPEIIVSVNNVEIKSIDIQAYGYILEVINNFIYVDLTTYITNLLITTQVQPPVVEIQTYTHELLNPDSSAYWQIPQQLEANPTNLEVQEISGSNLVQQFASIISNQPGFTGMAYGGVNNYRDSIKNRSLGNFILQNTCPALKSMLISSENDLDFVIANRFSADEYTKFKNKYLSVALQLINQEFNPVQYHNNTVDISIWVTEILRILNISKEFSKAFSYSFMAASGAPLFRESMTVNGNNLVTLTDYIDLGNPINVMYIYDLTNSTNIRLLTVGIDYEIVSTNLAIDIQLKLGSSNKDLVFYLYQSPLPTYIPSTPSKLGMYNVYVPRIEVDYSYAIPATVIIGHDGSKTIGYNDYRDNLLLEIETRIYNFVQHRFRNEYYIPLRNELNKSGYFRKTRYTRDEYLEITESYLNKWSAKNKANYRANDWESASVSTPIDQLWKLYNYRNAVTTDNIPVNLPGNWKGIFQYLYDTYYPDTRPWEMLGFSVQPAWWAAQYGPGILNSNGQTVWPNTLLYSDMWQDLEDGIIRQGSSAIYDPNTLQPLSQPMWARAGLSTIIPVDSAGEIIPIITLFNLNYTGNPYLPFDHFDDEWVYGDGAPVEQAWMSTSIYPYNIQEFLYIMKPGPFGELMFDTLGTELSPGKLNIQSIAGPVISNKNWQYVQNNLYLNDDIFFEWMRPKNKDQIVHAETIDNVVEVRFGYQAWISDRILFLGKNVSDVFGQKIRTLDVNLANKLAGFTNKDTTNLYIQSSTPGVGNSNLIIPSTNYDVILHKSPPIFTYSYSGVIIRALSDGTFVVYGYDLLSSEFTIINRSLDKLVEVSVGGTPASFQQFIAGHTYNAGVIVRHNGVYYESLVSQTVQKIDLNSWVKLKMLPTVGGVTVTYKPVSSTIISKIPYGTILATAQDVFDFLISWGAFLESQGWQFQEVNQDTNIINDWLSSAKQFLFWLNTNWAPNASIQLSPLANNASLIVETGYPDNVETLTNGVYSILDKYGIAIPPNQTTVERDGRFISVSPSNLSTGGIYFLSVNTSETEHILIFDNTTSFNDIIYSPLLRARQERLRFNGFRSNGWYGKMEASGYLIMDNQLVPNFDTIVNAMRYYYDPNVTIDNPSLEDLGRHLIGYESKSYLDNLQVSNDVQYLFYQGAIRQKGTTQALDKLFRSTKVQSNEIIKVYEEWALKLSNFGNTIEQVSTEFRLIPEQNTGEVLVAKLNFVPSSVGFIKEIKILNAENIYIEIPKVIIPLPDATPAGSWSNFSPIMSYVIGSIVRYDDLQGNPIYYSSNIIQGPGSFISANWTPVLITRIAKAYIVLDTVGRISRVDMTDPGFGYLTAPYVEIDAGLQDDNLDRLYSIWQGEIIKDTNIDNIINIDIDQTDIWVNRPEDPTVTLIFPETENIDYPIPNAGYVNFNDIALYSFDVETSTTLWGTREYNPIESNSIWVAKTFTEDWNVYKLYDISLESEFNVIENNDGNLYLRTSPGYLITPQFSTISGNQTDFGNMIVLQVIEATASASILAGVVNAIVLEKTGANYIEVPEVLITGDGTGATAIATIAGGEVTGITILNGGTGYTAATINIASPLSVSGDNNFSIGFQFNEIETINDPSYNYYDLLTLAGNPISSSDIPNFANFTKLMLFKTLRFLQMPSLPDYINTDDKIWVDLTGSAINYKWTVYKFDGTLFNEFRKQEDLIETSFFESATVFNTSGAELIQLPIYDPFKNILPALARQNLSYTSLQDPARYNVTDNPILFSENIIFSEQQVGKLWWDLSNTRFVYYEQPIALDGSETESDNLIYRRDRWAQLFPGSVVNVYEWVKSQVPPSQYTGSGIPRSITSYVQITTTNRFTNITETNYYFWVLGSSNKPNIKNRTLAALDVSRLLQSPKSQGISFFCPIQQTENNNSYIFYNVQDILAYRGDNIQIKYRISARDDQKHTQWQFFREGDINSLVTAQYWEKMTDSLCGYTKLLVPSDEFLNGILIANYLPWDVFGWDIAPWDNATLTTMPLYGETLPVPDPTLSEGEKYGISYRPRQGMFNKIYTARKVFVQAANSLLKYIPIRDDNPTWNINVLTDDYWTYTNWYAVGYENAVPTIVFQTLTDANDALVLDQLSVGTILQVTDGTIDSRYVLYIVTQPNINISTLSLEEIGIENSAIKLLDTLYTTINRYNLSLELRQLIDAFRTEIMIDAFLIDQNELFFSILNYVVSEQKNPDWVFKTSYIYIKEDNIPLTQDRFFVPDQIDNVIDFIIDSKPYHTQVRDYISTFVTTDLAVGTSSDSHKIKINLSFGPNFAGTQYYVPTNIVDPMIGWDFDQGQYNQPWDTINWDINDIAMVINQFISRNPVIPTFSPGAGNPWPDTYTVPITVYDASKVGYSQLYPYTFDFNNLNINNPQSFITPNNVVAVQIGDDTLYYGQDYYVEYNNDTTYTIYFYNDPGTSVTPVAFVWWNGGDIMSIIRNSTNSETVDINATDDMVINVDTQLPVNNSTGILTPYVGFGEYWDSIPDPIATIIIGAGGSASIPWSAVLEVELLENTISYKENINQYQGATFYRNSEISSGILLHDLDAPTEDTYNINTMTVYVDPITHPGGTNILPDPTNSPGVVWVNGERIEYRDKELIAANTWELKLLTRGTNGTGITSHLALIPSLADPLIFVPNPVWVEENNTLIPTADITVWNASDSSPDLASIQNWDALENYLINSWINYSGNIYSATENINAGGLAPNINAQWQLIISEYPIYSNISSSSLGGLWYSVTQESIFLKAEQGISIP